MTALSFGSTCGVVFIGLEFCRYRIRFAGVRPSTPSSSRSFTVWSLHCFRRWPVLIQQVRLSTTENMSFLQHLLEVIGRQICQIDCMKECFTCCRWSEVLWSGTRPQSTLLDQSTPQLVVDNVTKHCVRHHRLLTLRSNALLRHAQTTRPVTFMRSLHHDQHLRNHLVSKQKSMWSIPTWLQRLVSHSKVSVSWRRARLALVMTQIRNTLTNPLWAGVRMEQ